MDAALSWKILPPQRLHTAICLENLWVNGLKPMTHVLNRTIQSARLPTETHSSREEETCRAPRQSRSVTPTQDRESYCCSLSEKYRVHHFYFSHPGPINWAHSLFRGIQVYNSPATLGAHVLIFLLFQLHFSSLIYKYLGSLNLTDSAC